MRETLTIRLTKPLAEWLEQAAASTGQAQGAIIRSQLEKARAEAPQPKAFMRHAGAISGPANLSRRKGFSRK